jgi:hypothetical protein
MTTPIAPGSSPDRAYIELSAAFERRVNTDHGDVDAPAWRC